MRTNVKVRIHDGADAEWWSWMASSPRADAVILATGGIELVRQETNGIAKVAGHTIHRSLQQKFRLAQWRRFIQGGELRALSLHNVALSVLNSKKPVVTSDGYDFHAF